jgi:hypothetical protein
VATLDLHVAARVLDASDAEAVQGLGEGGIPICAAPVERDGTLVRSERNRGD